MRRRLLISAIVTSLAACHAAPPPALAEPGAAGPKPARTVAPEEPWAERLAALDAAIERERSRLGIPGAALVIVKDGRVVHTRAWGHRRRGGEAAVGSDTLFAIGSTTKAFTAMLAMQAVDAGKLSLGDHPSKCLPGFAIKGAGNDKLTVRDLATHTSGLPTADLAWATGALGGAELLQVMAQIEPVAAPREAFHYQNLAYLALGTCAANALGGEYESLLREQILDRVGMSDATLRVAQMQARRDVAFGHHRAEDGTTREVPMRALDGIAPAGAINASVDMLAGWLLALTDGGKAKDGPLVSDASFAELFRPQFATAPGVDYTLGWAKTKAGKRDYFSHTGGIDGFTALVGLVPSERLGFALLTNVDHGDLLGVVSNGVLELLDPPRPAAGKPDVPVQDELGTYGILGGFKVRVLAEGEGMKLVVQGQPAYPLVLVKGRRYRLGGAAPAGFAAEFQPAKADPTKTELLLVQPFGNLLLPRLEPDVLQAAASATPPASMLELVGSYAIAGTDARVELTASEGTVAMTIPGQFPAPLLPIAEGRYALGGLPEGFWLAPVRSGKKLTGLVLHQPDREVALTLAASAAPPAIPLAKVLAGRAKAHGSKALATRRSWVMKSRLELVHQGVTGTATTLRAPGDRWLEDVTLLAAGKEIGRVRIGRNDGVWQRISFSPGDVLEPLGAKAIELDSQWLPFGTETTGFSSAEVWRSDTVDGQPVVVVRMTTDWGAVVLDSYDRKTWLLRQRVLDLPIDRNGARMTETRRYADYRTIAGVAIPHRIEADTVQGKVVSHVEEVRFDDPLAPEAFAPPP
jgi:CubicO group peptidase (beta-lactamase class C family)